MLQAWALLFAQTATIRAICIVRAAPILRPSTPGEVPNCRSLGDASHVDGMRSHGCTSLPASTSGLHNPTRLEDQANAARLKPVQSLRHLIRLVALARNVCSLSYCM